MRFYTGFHHPIWLERATIPACVSVITLINRRRLPRSVVPSILDSGAFTQITSKGRFDIPPKTYARFAQRYQDEVGLMDRAAIQDWMCEPFALAKTGLTVAEHQKRTVESLSELRYYAPDVEWMPVLQGYHLDEYLAHLELYADYGYDLADEPIVGVGSICRRHATREAENILATLQARGLKLHGFGLKETALPRVAGILASADSMAWSFRARRSQIKLPGCTHKTCANCLKWATIWGKRIQAITPISTIQQSLCFVS